MKEYKPKIKAFVVYKTNGSWRGFCVPYDVTCEAETKREALRRLEKLVRLYEERLEKYVYPKHLSIRPLSDKDDQIIFQKVWKKIISDIEQDFLEFQAKKQKEEFKMREPVNLYGYYLCPA